MTTKHINHQDGRADRALPDLTSYLQLHQALRRAHDQLVFGLNDPAAEEGRRSRALNRWFRGFAGELRHHHHLEDSVFFPALAARVPTYAECSATVEQDHLRLERLIDQTDRALCRLAQRRSDPTELRAAALAVAVELRDFMAAHIDFEDRDILPMFERRFSADEYAVLDARGPKEITVRQAMFTVPWFMATVEPASAAKTLREAPLPLKLIYRLTRRRYARLVRVAFGGNPDRHLGERGAS